MACDLIAAAHVVANVTDLCSVFVLCDKRFDVALSKCTAAVPSAPQSSRLQAAYGAFREAFVTLGVRGSDGIYEDTAIEFATRGMRKHKPNKIRKTWRREEDRPPPQHPAPTM